MAIDRFNKAVSRSLRERLSAWLQMQAESTRTSYEVELQGFANWAGAVDINEALSMLVRPPAPEFPNAMLVMPRTDPSLPDAALVVPSVPLPDTAAIMQDIGRRVLAVYLEYQSFLATCPVWDKHGKAAGMEPRRGYAPATQELRLTALRGAIRVAQQAQLCPSIPFPAGPKSVILRDTSGIGIIAWRKVCKTLDKVMADATPGSAHHACAVRDHLVIRMLHDLALRRAEVQRLQIQWIRADGEAIGIWRKGGAQNERDYLRLGESIKRSIKMWVDIRGDHKGALITHPRGTKAITLSAINKLCSKWGELAGIGRMTPHQLRHDAITAVSIKSGGNLVLAQAFARHANPKMTKRYLDNLGEEALHGQNLLTEDDEDE